MSFNSTPNANRVHIGFFGCRNAGKSSLVNAVTGQSLAVVSDVKGTTTDPVYKAMELLPLGPVMVIDTPGFDDHGDLGGLRVEKTRQVLAKTHIAVLVVHAVTGMTQWDHTLIELFKEKNTPYLTVYNQCDLLDTLPEDGLYVSAKTGYHIPQLKERLSRMIKPDGVDRPLISDKLQPGGLAILVTPIDTSAPKGRLILPQQQVMRDLLDHHMKCMVVQPEELADALSLLNAPPAVVITDSQVFGKVAKLLPETIPLTSFSILMARAKGFLEWAVQGAAKLEQLQDGDTVLIAEGCTHHRQCEDIGTVKLPGWITDFTGKKLQFRFTSGTEFPSDLTGIRLVVHCGGCMLNNKEVVSRMKTAHASGVAFTNYGTAIAHINGILRRSLSLFPELTAF